MNAGLNTHLSPHPTMEVWPGGCSELFLLWEMGFNSNYMGELTMQIKQLAQHQLHEALVDCPLWTHWGKE
jgi:hypothetical protein